MWDILSHPVWESCSKYLYDLENWENFFSFKKDKNLVKMLKLELCTEKYDIYVFSLKHNFTIFFCPKFYH